MAAIGAASLTPQVVRSSFGAVPLVVPSADRVRERAGSGATRLRDSPSDSFEQTLKPPNHCHTFRDLRPRSGEHDACVGVHRRAGKNERLRRLDILWDVLVGTAGR